MVHARREFYARLGYELAGSLAYNAHEGFSSGGRLTSGHQPRTSDQLTTAQQSQRLTIAPETT